MPRVADLNGRQWRRARAGWLTVILARFARCSGGWTEADENREFPDAGPKDAEGSDDQPM